LSKTAGALEHLENLSVEERIERRAQELYVERGDQAGSELNDWLQAEQEIRRAERLRLNIERLQALSQQILCDGLQPAELLTTIGLVAFKVQHLARQMQESSSEPEC